jgi:hypothetical protein
MVKAPLAGAVLQRMRESLAMAGGMIEQIARALYERFPSTAVSRLQVRGRKSNIAHTLPWEEAPARYRDRLLEDARTAIGAMRVPSASMGEAGTGMLRLVTNAHDLVGSEALETWQTMIDAALAEEG